MSKRPPEWLIAALSVREHATPNDKFQPLTGGRTNGVWHLIRTNGARPARARPVGASADANSANGGNAEGAAPVGDAVLKLFHANQDNPLFHNSAGDEIRCLQQLEGTGLAPSLLAWGHHRGQSWILYRHQAGQQWKTGPAPVARLLWRLHRRPPIQGLALKPGGSAELERQTRAILNRCSPQGRARVDRASKDCPPADPHTESRSIVPCDSPRLLHGDPVPGNLVVKGEDVTLIDWQCPALGDPCHDLALFVSPAMQLLYRGNPLTATETRTFLQAYPDPDVTARYLALAPHYHRRMAAYCLWQAECGKADYADGMELELRALRQGASAA